MNPRGCANVLAARLARITIFTSSSPSPSNLSSTFDGWTNRSYQHDAYSAIGTVTFDLPVEGQYVAVVSENDAALTLAEVEVYGK